MAPRFAKDKAVHGLEWSDEAIDVSKAMSSTDAKDIRADLIAIYRGQPKRAAKAMSLILSATNNALLK